MQSHSDIVLQCTLSMEVKSMYEDVCDDFNAAYTEKCHRLHWAYKGAVLTTTKNTRFYNTVIPQKAVFTLLIGYTAHTHIYIRLVLHNFLYKKNEFLRWHLNPEGPRLFAKRNDPGVDFFRVVTYLFLFRRIFVKKKEKFWIQLPELGWPKK